MNMSVEDVRRMKAREVRYKKPILEMFNLEHMGEYMMDMKEQCSDVIYAIEGDPDTLLSLLDGDDEELQEMKLAFYDLDYKIDRLSEKLNQYVWEDYNPFDLGELLGANYERMDDTLALMADSGFPMLGYDAYEDDYFPLEGYEAMAGAQEAEKRLMKLTKKELIGTFRAALACFMSFLDIKFDYDRLKTYIDLVQGEQRVIVDAVNKICELYDKGQEGDWKADIEFRQYVKRLPDRVWLE